MKKVDFLFIYEHKMRELDSLCLLKCELEKKGYKVDIVSCAELNCIRKPIFDAEVVVIPGCAGNISTEYYVGRFVKFNKIISMQREQIMCTIAEEDKGGWNKIGGIGTNACIFCWNSQSKKWLVEKQGCSDCNARVVGNISMDFCKERFNKFYYNKDEISKKYNLDKEKKWITFISSFSLVGLSNSEMDDLVKDIGMPEYYDLWDISVKSQTDILKWFSALLEKEEDVIIIYRPHPGEIVNENLKEMMIKYNNFKIILGESVQQWIHVTDKVYTWISTSLADAMFSGVPCSVLRPYEIPAEFDIVLYKKSKYIKDEEGFMKSISSKESYFPISLEDLKECYYFNEKKYTYEEEAEICEEVYKSSKYKISIEEMSKFKEYQKDKYKNESIKSKIKGNIICLQIYYFLLNKCNLRRFKKKSRDEFFKEIKSNKEIKDICTRIRRCI